MDHNEKKSKDQISSEPIESILQNTPGAMSLPSVGLIVLALGIFSSSLMHLYVLAVQKDWYWQIHGHLSEPFITLRYLFSLFQRFFGITVGFGILRVNELSRKLLIGLGVFSILVLPWKHSYQGFVTHTAILDDKYAELVAKSNAYLGTDLVFSDLVVPSMVAHWLGDAIFWGFVFWYVTRPKVKALFRT